MLVVHEWPARVPCPGCRKLRVVTRDRCEYCGAVHASPAFDGTEIIEPAEAVADAALA
jgi:ribosomal protein S27E